MAKRKNWEDDYSPDIIKQVRNRDYSAGGADAVYMSDEDYAKVLRARSIYDSADDAGKAALHDDIERLRAGYNYSGGEAGDEYIKLGGYSYGRAPEYESSYSELLDAAYDRLRDREPFEYDYESDPLWHSYKKQYVREGRRGSEDTLGQYASLTGGQPSSAAVTAASQARDYYNAKMTDRIPELYKLAYDMYKDGGDALEEEIKLLRALDEDEYGRYRDRRADYDRDRSFDYGLYSDTLKREREDAQSSAKRESEAEERDYKRAVSARDDSRARIKEYLSSGGTLGALDAGIIAESGYTLSELSALEEKYQRQLSEQAEKSAAKSGSAGSSSSGGSGSSSSGRSSGSSSSGEQSGEESESVTQRMLREGVSSETEARQWLLDHGYGSAQWKLNIYLDSFRDALGKSTNTGGAEVESDYGELKRDIMSLINSGAFNLADRLLTERSSRVIMSNAEEQLLRDTIERARNRSRSFRS